MELNYLLVLCLRYQKRHLIIAIALLLCIAVFYISRTGTGAIVSIDIPYVVVHLDLKGMPPKMSYLNSMLPKLKSLGANALLMEYEDMFPYKGKLYNLSSKYAYTEKELSDFLTTAHNNGFEIIPLVQTFGHMEYVLKLEEFKMLRENPYFSDTICPSKKESQHLIKLMLQQVIDFHNKIYPLKHLHIGCDEVYSINSCSVCKQKYKGETNIDIYKYHVNNVYATMKSINPNISVMIWDDMLIETQKRPGPVLNKLLNMEIEPVHWSYSPKAVHHYIHIINHVANFKHTWVATAYKGADGRTSALPNLTMRFRNNYDWLKFIYDYNRTLRLKGIILTGWSRYGHMDPPTDPLPTAMPSLILNLLLARKFRNGFEKTLFPRDWQTFYDVFIEPEFKKEIECAERKKVDLKYEDIIDCDSKYSYSVNASYYFNQFRKHLIDQYYFDWKGFYSIRFYNEVHKTVSRNSLRFQTEIQEEMKTLQKLKEIVKEMLMQYYSNAFFVNEYVDLKTDYLMELYGSLLNDLRNVYQLRTWKRCGD